MNTLESYVMESPSGSEETCAKFIIEEILSPFTLHNIATIDEQYTLSLWVKSESDSSIFTCGTEMPTTTEWTRYVVTFVAKQENISIYFNTIGNYYIYHPKLELGAIDTEWTEAPEDITERIEQAQQTADRADATASDASTRLSTAESIIQQLNDSISTLITDANGSSLMQQTADGGWTYSMAQTEETIASISALLADLELALDNTEATVEKLNNSLTGVESSLEWVKVTTYEDEPCIALGETDSDFKLLITNTRIMFVEGSSVPAYISNQALNIKKAVIEEELQQGEFVWKIRTRSDGSKNFGLLWKGVSS